MNTHEALIIIGQNSVTSPHYSAGSFVGRLHEEGVWDHYLFHELSDALNALAVESASQDIKGIAFDIYSYVVGVSLLAHADPNDGFKINNISMEEFYDLRDKVEVAFRRLLGSRKFLPTE